MKKGPIFGLCVNQVTRVSNDMEEVDLSINNSLSQSALLLQSISSLQDSIQGKKNNPT